MSDFSRRTVVRGAAWTVPVVAVAAQVPAFAASNVPPPPVINFGGSCANTGAEFKGCGGDKTLQVPLTLSNPGPTAVIFQITAMYTCNCTTAPSAAGSGVAVGVRGIFATPNHTVPSQNDCTLVTPPSPACSGGIAGGNVLVPAGTTNATYWIESSELGSSSTFSSRITWRLLAAGSCAVLRTGEAFTAAAISPANCNG